MKKTRILSPLLLLIALFAAATAPAAADDAQKPVCPPKTFRYRVAFTDKANNPYSVKRPQEFLSAKALARRAKYRLKVDEHDLPVSPVYLQYLSDNGYRVVNVSKWNNTAVVETADSAGIKRLADVKFVKSLRCVYESPDSIYPADVDDRKDQITALSDTLADAYGHSRHQTSMLGVDRMHEDGFRGEGVTIAVIDGGFYNADCIPAFKNTKILSTRNFVRPGRSVFEESTHGTMVLGCIAPDIKNSLVGTAPDAAFHLLVSEDVETEQMWEEDNWCTALEYADSVGADIVTSSLGYYHFDNGRNNHKYSEQDGHTAANSAAASLAASRGLLVLTSAGNEGRDAWKKISFPGDAVDVLTVGAVDSLCVNATFSSVGNTADGRTKPDVMAQGVATWLIDGFGDVTTANGTSFSCPLTAGAVACLLQACPNARPTEIIDAVRRAGDNAATPNNIFGYGIPDVHRAMEILKNK